MFKTLRSRWAFTRIPSVTWEGSTPRSSRNRVLVAAAIPVSSPSVGLHALKGRLQLGLAFAFAFREVYNTATSWAAAMSLVRECVSRIALNSTWQRICKHGYWIS